MSNQAKPEDGRLHLLAQFLTPEIITLVRQRVSDEQFALLIVEALNPHKDLSTADKAKRDGVSERTVYRK